MNQHIASKFHGVLIFANSSLNHKISNSNIVYVQVQCNSGQLTMPWAVQGEDLPL